MLLGVDSLASVEAPFAGGIAITNRWEEQCGCYETLGCNQFWQVQNARRLEVSRCSISAQAQAQSQAAQQGG